VHYRDEGKVDVQAIIAASKGGSQPTRQASKMRNKHLQTRHSKPATTNSKRESAPATTDH
jgi:hypothetical protein